METEKDELLGIIQNSIIVGQTKTRDGRIIDNYINGHYIFSNPRGLDLCTRLFWEIISEFNIKAICGIVTGACPLVTSLSYYSYKNSVPLAGVYIRKEKNTYGFESFLSVKIQPGTKVVLIDDVATKGRCAETAIEALRDEKVDVVSFISLIDRNLGVRETMRRIGVEYRYLFTMEDIMKKTANEISVVDCITAG